MKLIERRYGVVNIVTGIIDGTIDFCPYCGSELFLNSFICATHCEDCGRNFYVIEGESEVQEDE